MGKAMTIYSELSTAREWATITCILAGTRRQATGWESFVVERGKAASMPRWKLLVWGSCRWADQKWGILRDWLGVHIWLSKDLGVEWKTKGKG